MGDGCHIFGVRHLSPAASRALLETLDLRNPDCVLVEGPADAAGMLRDLARNGVVPPVALLLYTTTLPITTAFYPFADYSPEYQAVLWAVRHGKELRFIDLPSDVMLGLRDGEPPSAGDDADLERRQAEAERAAAFNRFHHDLYEQLAAAMHEGDYESYWERAFEHNALPVAESGAFPELVNLQSSEMRLSVESREAVDAAHRHAYNLVREAHMRRAVSQAAADGLRPEKTLAVVGAYHVMGLDPALPPMRDEEFAALPRTPSRMTLMPYSYHRLSSRTGYGAGNRAPLYFETVWKALRTGRLDSVPARYLAEVARHLRERGNNASTAAAIEGVRLAQALASLRGTGRPVLRDLHDAAVACFGGGEPAVVAEALAIADVGTAMGKLPEGVSQTPVQEDLDKELARLKLAAYKSPVPQELVLDLRENFKAKSEAAAFLDLSRSTLLHRLSVLGIDFAKQQGVSQDAASWKEVWQLQWSPETEIQVVEANLKGETLEVAAAYQLAERLGECPGIADAAAVIRIACECRLTGIFDSALSGLQALLVDAVDIRETAAAARELSLLLKYGDVRRFDLGALQPILQQLFLRGTLLLVDAAVCDDKAATGILAAMTAQEHVSREQHETVDVAAWHKELGTLARRDDRNTRLSGAAFALLLEHNLASEEECAREVSRRLSPGVPADLGAGWFEGLASRNRYALLSRVPLWRELDGYVRGLDDDEFKRAVVFLRRAFGPFEPGQKNSIAELLGGLWGGGAEETAEILQAELTEEENAALGELNDFDFDI